jgi:hypothetical protein
MEFIRRFEEIAMASGFERMRSPATALSVWKQFVDECERCYHWNIYEYDNDLSVRDLLERALTDKELSSLAQFDDFAGGVRSIDAQFRSLLRTDAIRTEKKTWWRRGVLRYGQGEYRADVRESYGIEIEECPKND